MLEPLDWAELVVGSVCFVLAFVLLRFARSMKAIHAEQTGITASVRTGLLVALLGCRIVVTTEVVDIIVLALLVPATVGATRAITRLERERIAFARVARDATLRAERAKEGALQYLLSQVREMIHAVAGRER